MRVVYTPEAFTNLNTILTRLLGENPIAAFALAKRIDDAIMRIAVFPKSAPVVGFAENIRVVTLTRYPYRIFYRVTLDAIEILHVRHTSRVAWEGGR